MNTTTPNYNLIKPGQDEFYDVSVPNANMDTIDGVLKTLQDAINSGATEQEIAQIRQDLAAHLADEEKHLKAGERTSWNAKETPEGAQEKANIAETNAKNASIPLSQKGKPNGVAALDADGYVLNGNGKISGGSQTGEFTDTTTVIKAGTLYTKRIPLNGSPKAGRIHVIQYGGTNHGVAEFTTDRTQSTGFMVIRGSASTSYVGFDGYSSGIFGYNINHSANITLNGVWIDKDTNELVLEFKNINPASTATDTMGIARVNNGNASTTGLIWEVW